MLLLAACAIEAEKPQISDTDTACVPSTTWSDLDADGYGDPANAIEACDAPAGYVANADDCDDASDGANPAAVETCDGTDQDCDGVVDDDPTDGTTWYQDLDSDGAGNDATATQACAAPEGYIAVGGDCDDLDKSSGVGETWFLDGDADGFGGDAVVACAQPEGSALVDGDCDDADGGVFPGAAELCDDLDQDCDAAVDEDATDPLTWYADEDGDGYGGSEVVEGCDAPEGYVDEAGDCDDGSAALNPGATETCSGIDEDCDGLVDADDPDMSGVATWYRDADGDGHGVSSDSVESCVAPEGYVIDGDDCDDADARAYPSADETCDGTDEDCDGVVDNAAIDAVEWYADDDGDGFGDAVAVACEAPVGSVAEDGDCDDADAFVFPGADEVCDGADSDCDGTVDDGEWYADADGDGFGDASAVDVSCAAPAGYVADSSDCDDGAAGVSPSGVETCDDVDQDCDGEVDEGPSDPSDWYLDSDGDGFGAGAAFAACDMPVGYSATADDCNDLLATIAPGADEHCDDIDEDCDGTADDAAIDPSDWYPDLDGDGFGAGTAVSSCDAPVGYVSSADDCDDGSAAISPDAYETCADGIDQDCDGADATTCDADGDGYDVSTDCDDSNAEVNPGEKEVCDSADTDEDCDGKADNDDTSASATSKTRYYEDADGDEYGDPGGKLLCDIVAGYVDNDEDCDDGDDTISPDAQDVCSSGVDEDCSGEVDDCTRYDVGLAGLSVSGEHYTFGSTVVAGDFGGTGDRTLLLGAYLDDDYDGAVHLFDGSVRGSLTEADHSAELVPTKLGSWLSYSAFLVGDSDADGLDDLCVDSWVIYGGDVGVGGEVDALSSAEVTLGTPRSFGDFDGDGLDDLVVLGAASTGGYSSGILLGPVFGDYYSWTYAEVEISPYPSGTSRDPQIGVDFDGDGTDSLVFGSPSPAQPVIIFDDPLHAASYVDADWTIDATSGTDLPSTALTAMDADGDGVEELAFASGGVTSAAAAWLVPQVTASGAVSALASATLAVDGSYDYTFESIAASDLDGDGADEIAIGSYTVDTVFVIDDWSGAVEIADLPFTGVGAVFEGDTAGVSLTNAGDTDGDGTEDLLIGGYGYAWLWEGSAILP